MPSYPVAIVGQFVRNLLKPEIVGRTLVILRMTTKMQMANLAMDSPSKWRGKYDHHIKFQRMDE